MNMTGDFCGYKKQSFYLKINSCLFIGGIVSYWVDSDRIYQETAIRKMALAAFLLVILGLSPMASAADWSYSGKF